MCNQVRPVVILSSTYWFTIFKPELEEASVSIGGEENHQKVEQGVSNPLDYENCLMCKSVGKIREKNITGNASSNESHYRHINGEERFGAGHRWWKRISHLEGQRKDKEEFQLRIKFSLIT